MALYVGCAHTKSGQAFAATVQRMSTSYYWNPTAAAFQAVPSYANKRIALVEGSAENARSYTAAVSGLGSPGRVRVRIHDEGATNAVVGEQESYVVSGNEVVIDMLLSTLSTELDLVALEATLTTMKGATFATATDSQEAIRDAIRVR